MKPNFKFKIGDIVTHNDITPSLIGVIVDRGYLGQIERENEDFDLNPIIDHERDLFGLTEPEYYQPWYRIRWIFQDGFLTTKDFSIQHKPVDPTTFKLEHRFKTPTRLYNGQESEGVLELV